MEKRLKNILVFGYGLGLICAFVALRLSVRQGISFGVKALAVAALVSTGLAAFRSPWLEAFYNSWLKVTRVIGTIMTAVILTVVFYCVFAPAGIVLRLRKKDLLDRKVDPAAESYWIRIDGGDKARESYLKQY